MKQIGETGPEHQTESDHSRMKHSVSSQITLDSILFLLLHLTEVTHKVFVFFRQNGLEPGVNHPVEKVKLDATVGMGAGRCGAGQEEGINEGGEGEMEWRR